MRRKIRINILLFILVEQAGNLERLKTEEKKIKRFSERWRWRWWQKWLLNMKKKLLREVLPFLCSLLRQFWVEKPKHLHFPHFVPLSYALTRWFSWENRKMLSRWNFNVCFHNFSILGDNDCWFHRKTWKWNFPRWFHTFLTVLWSFTFYWGELKSNDADRIWIWKICVIFHENEFKFLC